MNLTKTLAILSLLVGQLNLFGQCSWEEAYMQPKPEFLNEVDFYSDMVDLVSDSLGNYFLKIDTNKLHQPDFIVKKEFFIFDKTAIFTENFLNRNCYLEIKNNADSQLIFTDTFLRADYTNAKYFVFINVYIPSHKSLIINKKTGEIIKIPGSYTVVGNSDTCIYLRYNGFKPLKNKDLGRKLKYGNCVALSSNGIRLIAHTTIRRYSLGDTFFFSEQFKVFSKELYEIDFDCETFNVCKIKVFHNQKLIDSFERTTPRFASPGSTSAVQYGDTLEVFNHLYISDNLKHIFTPVQPKVKFNPKIIQTIVLTSGN
ncbi:MAG: hypothetical protein H6607_09665 [Flavobacteriales bacterium]|nr:hypothetical protein [Flavobacteriales bacterium]